MWIKRFVDGTQIEENRRKGRTWLKTPLNNIAEVLIICNGHKSTVLSGYNDYWHSRSAVAMDDGKVIEVSERIQGLMDDGRWYTVEWDGIKFNSFIADQPIGKPVLNNER